MPWQAYIGYGFYALLLLTIWLLAGGRIRWPRRRP